MFVDIIDRYGYTSSEVLVVGDDLHSEIKAAQDLGIDAVLYDNFNLHPKIASIPKVLEFKQLQSYLI